MDKTLKCYDVLELKAGVFEPEYAGKLNFNVNAVDELLKTTEENPTIGLLVCKSKDQSHNPLALAVKQFGCISDVMVGRAPHVILRSCPLMSF